MKKYLKISAVLITISFAVWISLRSNEASAQQKVETAGQKFKSIQVLNDMPADQMGKVMNMMSASLGVDCKFCHARNDGDYEKEGIEHKDIARNMIRMTFALNKTNFNGRPEINCNTCHNGKSHPQPSFPLGVASTPEERPRQPDKRPAAEDIIAKYELALGGADKLARITSMQIKASRVEPDGKTVEPETVWVTAGKYAAQTVYPNYVVTEVFDGSAGRKYGNSEAIEVRADEVEQIKREADLFSPATLRKAYAKLDYRAVERVNGKEVHLVLGTTPSGARERLAFDVTSGLLVRRSASSPTIFGNFVYQVDYSDYKDFAGIKMPTSIHYSVPHMSWTRKVVEVKTNVTIDPSIFTGPTRKS